MERCCIESINWMCKCSYCHNCNYSHKKYYSVFLCNSYRLHSHEYYNSSNHIIYYLCCPQWKSKPVHKYLRSTINIATYSYHNRKSIHHKNNPAEYFLHHSMEQLTLKAFYKLHTAVVIRKFRNYKMQNYINDVSCSYHPDNINHTVLSCKIRNCYNSRSYTVSHNHAYCLKCGELCF